MLCLGALITLLWLEREIVVLPLTWLRLHGLLTAALAAIAAIGVLASVSTSYALVVALSRSGKIALPFTVAAYLSGGIALGVIGSFLVPQPKPVDLPPGSRCVPHRKVRRAARIRPSFGALGLWPIRQALAWAQPKIVARATIPILLSMGLGTTADVALIVIALSGVIGALLFLLLH